MHSLYSCRSWWLFNKLWRLFCLSTCDVALSRFVVIGGSFHLVVTLLVLEIEVLCCSISLGQAFSLDLWVLISSIPRCDMWQMPLLALKQNLFYTGRTNQSHQNMAFRKMNVVMEKDLNLWFGLFIYLLGSSCMLYVLQVMLPYVLLSFTHSVQYLLLEFY